MRMNDDEINFEREDVRNSVDWFVNIDLSVYWDRMMVTEIWFGDNTDCW